mgnify:CR=1 FL=1
MTKIIGISSYYHDSAVALIDNGKIIYASQEERFSRIKHDKSFPLKALKNLLTYNDVKLSQIDKVVFFEKPFLKFERLIETYLDFAPKGFFQFLKAMPIWLNEKLFMKKIIIRELKKIDKKFDDKKVLFSEHHLSHAASCFYPSPFEKAVILTADGVGEWTTTSIALGDKNKIKILKEIQFPNSLGLLYSALTYYLGFKVNSGEYKLMGLAPYGEPKYTNLIKNNLIDIKEDGSFRLNQKYFNYSTGFTMTNDSFDDLFKKKKRESETEIQKFHMDIASSIQEVTEEIILKISMFIKKKYNIDNLCLAGGVALNCVANGKIYKKKVFKNIWVQPAAGDAGGALGAALAYWFLELKKKRVILKTDSMSASFLGDSYSNTNIEKDLKFLGAKFSKYKDSQIIKKTAKAILKGKAIGWFQGRMEYGPRALGNRSIVADPRNKKMQKVLNLKVKFRESFRPFAPAILKEHVSNWFEFNNESKYMLMVANVKKNKLTKNSFSRKRELKSINSIRSEVPSITHIDNSARIQTVDQNDNDLFYKLIKEFYKLTKVPILINTSFNIRGEPIVSSPKDAFNCFMGSNLDILVIGSFFLEKDKQDKKLKRDYRSSFKLD